MGEYADMCTDNGICDWGTEHETYGFDEEDIRCGPKTVQERFNSFFRKRGMKRMAEKKESNNVRTPKFRVSFPNISEKSEMSNKYRLVMLFDEDADISALKKAARKACDEKWSKGPPKGFQSPFKDAGEKEYDGYEAGMIEIAASSNRRPGVVDKRNEPVELDDLDTFLYGGCYARAVVTPYAYDKMGNKGVGFGIQAIQIMGDGEPFGSHVNAQAVFDALDDDDDDAEGSDSTPPSYDF